MTERGTVLDVSNVALQVDELAAGHCKACDEPIPQGEPHYLASTEQLPWLPDGDLRQCWSHITWHRACDGRRLVGPSAPAAIRVYSVERDRVGGDRWEVRLTAGGADLSTGSWMGASSGPLVSARTGDLIRQIGDALHEAADMIDALERP